MKINIKLFYLVCLIFGLSLNNVFANNVANSSPYGDTYVKPCYKAPNGATYCNGIAGTYVFDDGTNKFWMPLNRINSNNIIIDRKLVEYDPKTKSVNWNSVPGFSVAVTMTEAVSAAIGGQGANYFYSVNSMPKTAEQIKAEKKNKELAKQKAIQDENKRKQKAQEQAKLAHQTALTKAMNDGTLISCKKLYWKLLPLGLAFTETFSDFDGTEKSYCYLKDGSTAMLQFEERVNSETGNKYKVPKLMDFTGKTKYYPWN